MVFDKVHILLFIRCRLAFFLIVYFALKTFLKIRKKNLFFTTLIKYMVPQIQSIHQLDLMLLIFLKLLT